MEWPNVIPWIRSVEERQSFHFSVQHYSIEQHRRLVLSEKDLSFEEEERRKHYGICYAAQVHYRSRKEFQVLLQNILDKTIDVHSFQLCWNKLFRDHHKIANFRLENLKFEEVSSNAADVRMLFDEVSFYLQYLYRRNNLSQDNEKIDLNNFNQIDLENFLIFIKHVNDLVIHFSSFDSTDN